MMGKFRIITNRAFESARGMKNIKALVNSVWAALCTTNPDPVVASSMVILAVANAGVAVLQAGTIVAACLITNIFMSGSIYAEGPLQEQLQGLLGPQTSMFGSARRTGVQRSTRVAVIAVKNRGQATTIANYNRPHSEFARSKNG